MSPILLKTIQCKHCGLIFHVCRSCFRGQAYCCDFCRHEARKKNHREAQRRYQQTEEGRETRRNAERMRRIKKGEKTVADQSSTPESSCDNVQPKWFGGGHRCHFCGRRGVVVKDFPRQGYGRKSESGMEAFP